MPPGGRVRGPAGGRAVGCPGCAARMRVAASQRSDPRPAAGLASVRRLQRFLQPSLIKGIDEQAEKDPIEYACRTLGTNSRGLKLKQHHRGFTTIFFSITTFVKKK